MYYSTLYCYRKIQEAVNSNKEKGLFGPATIQFKIRWPHSSGFWGGQHFQAQDGAKRLHHKPRKREMEVVEDPQSSLRVCTQDLTTFRRLKVLPLSNNGLLWDSHPTYRRRWRDLVSKPPPPSLSLQSSKCTVGLYFGVIIFRTMLLVIQSFVLPILCGQLEIVVELLR